MKAGDLVTVIYTKGFDWDLNKSRGFTAKSPIVGLVIASATYYGTAPNTRLPLRRRFRVLINGDTFWMDGDDLEVTSESR